jgi:hypothetical protein
MPVIALLENLGSSAFDDMLRLFGIAAIISVVFKGIRSFANKPAAAPVVSAPAKAAAKPNAPEEISPEIIAIIAAAVSCFTGQPQRIVSIKRQSTSWEKAGRQSVLSSHRIR